MPTTFDLLADAAHKADWQAVAQLTEVIRTGDLPDTEEERREYIRNLTGTLVAVKACRADMAMSAARLHAAAGFQNSRLCDEKRQNHAVVADL